MNTVIIRLLHLVGAKALTVSALVILTLLAVGQAIVDLVPSLERQLVFSTVVAGVLISWQLARTRLRTVIAVPVLFLVGLTGITVFVGHLGQNLVDLFTVLAYYQRQLLVNGVWAQIDWQLLSTSFTELATSVAYLYTRVYAWSQAAMGGRQSFDPAAAAVLWCAALWTVSCCAGWGVRRKRAALAAMLPALILISAICAFTGTNYMLLAWPAFSLVLLMVIVGHQAREYIWTVAGIDYSEDIRLDIALLVTPMTIGLIAAGWLIPSISLDVITQQFQHLIQAPAAQAQPIPESLGLKPAPQPGIEVGGSRAPGLPRSHLIGSGPELSRETVMIIRTGDYAPLYQYTGISFTAPRYYWRASTYDKYTGSGWLTSQTKAVAYSSSQLVISNTVPAVRLVRQDVIPAIDLGDLVYRAGTLTVADRDIWVEWRDQDQQDEFHTTFKLATGEYSVDSLISEATIEQLRSVKAEYPKWMNQRYLALPDDIPQRVLTLARDLTAVQPTPYDRAIVIESYLRTFSYTLDLPVPPAGRDVADYFLFDLKRGYCDYFATSMVVLARAAGLPARLVVGYAAGVYNPMNAEYVVTRADAHSWPEIYFNEYGWIEFEPTSGQAAIQRLTSLRQTSTERRALDPLKPRTTLLDNVGWYVAIGMLFILFGAYPVWLLLYGRWLSYQKPDDALRHIYTRLRMQGRRWSMDESPGDTPYQYLHALTLAPIAAKNQAIVERLRMQTSDDLRYLLSLFVRSTYSRKRADFTERWLAIRAWQRITQALMLAQILSVFTSR